VQLFSIHLRLISLVFGRGQDVFRVAILGLGGVAESIHLPACALLPDLKIVAACDTDARFALVRLRGYADTSGAPVEALWLHG